MVKLRDIRRVPDLLVLILCWQFHGKISAAVIERASDSFPNFLHSSSLKYQLRGIRNEKLVDEAQRFSTE